MQKCQGLLLPLKTIMKNMKVLTVKYLLVCTLIFVHIYLYSTVLENVDTSRGSDSVLDADLSKAASLHLVMTLEKIKFASFV
jgi:hypothetical protein